MQTITKGKIIAMLIGAGIVAWLVNRASEMTRELIQVGALPDDLIAAYGKRLADDPLFVSMHRVDLMAAACGAGLVVLVALYNLSKRKPTRRGEEQGSAGWADRKAIAKYGDKKRGNRIQLTDNAAMSLDTRRTQRNNNVLVVGGSGSGKSRSYVIPNVAALDCSMAVTDPKGEIREQTQANLEGRGFKVRTFNLVNLRESHGFNPMAYIDPEQPEASIAQLTEGIVTNTTAGERRGDQFWDRAERALLTALTAYAWATIPNASLADVADLHKRMASGEGKQAQAKSEVDLEFEAAREVVAEYRESGPEVPADVPADEAARRQRVEDRAMRVLDFACRQYRIYQQGPGETRMSVIISLGVRLAPLDMHEVRQIIRKDTIALDRIGMERTALFVELPDTHGTFNFLAALFWQSLFETNIYLSDHNEPRGLAVPVHCFLDEFANIGRIPNFERVIATIRSRGIGVSVIVQAMSQGKALWDDHWPTIVGNCDSILYLGSMDWETREWISKQLGEETVLEEDFSRSYGASGSSSRSQRSVKRALMTPEEVGRLPHTEAILMLRGERPYRSKKAPVLS